MRTAFKVIAVLVVGLVATVAAILTSIDPNDYRETLIAQVERQTGRTLAIGGEMDLSIGMTPAITARGLSFANADWGSRADMVELDEVAVEVALWPLLSGDVQVKRLVLTGLDVLLEVDADGRGNWVLADAAGGDGTAEQPEDGFALPAFGSVRMRAVTVAYRDGATGQTTTVNLETLDAETVAEGLQVDLAALVHGLRADLSAVVDVEQPGMVRLSRFRAESGPSSLAGDVTAVIAGTRPQVTATLTSPLIDTAACASADPVAAGTGDNQRLFGEAPLPFDALSAVDANVSLSVAKLMVDETTFEDVTLKLHLANGLLAAKPVSARLAGGDLLGEIVVDARPAPPTVKIAATGSGIDFGALLKQAEVTDMLTATGGLSVDVAGSGATVRQIMAGLGGQTDMVVDSGKIAGRYTDLIAADLFTTLAPWAQDEADTTLNCVVTRFAIDQGIARANGILLDTERVTVQGDGQVDLREETIDLVMKPRPKNVSLISLAAPIKIGGTLMAPTARPDEAAVALGVASAVAGTAINPLGILIPLVSAGTADKNPCVAALEGKAVAPESGGLVGTVEDAAKGVGESVGKAAEGVGGILKGIGDKIGETVGSGAGSTKED